MRLMSVTKEVLVFCRWVGRRIQLQANMLPALGTLCRSATRLGLDSVFLTSFQHFYSKQIAPILQALYDGSLQTRLGITSGLCTVVSYDADKKSTRFEALYSFYFGDYGHISVQGPYITTQDTYLAITGGSGVFVGCYGQVKLQQLVFPFKLFYTFYLQGIKKLPEALCAEAVPPSPSVQPSQEAKDCKNVVPNFPN
ncbi:hypothetical protein KC19_1G005700 [Ceratodon purpureus]|uniref:allene-oxide cyclase n=1 Tax=Ceratodon purpureus TaxID=3225 RepID=A0A8T0IZS3_CERPU|nr:hypothetical protein KC19_1G005700 [Ceratodon purpureus]